MPKIKPATHPGQRQPALFTFNSGLFDQPQTLQQARWRIGIPADATPAQRRAWNREALDLLECLEAEQRLTPLEAEREVLARYSGNGGIGGSLNEFYTPHELAELVWRQVLHHCQRPVECVLEPSVGTGVMAQDAPSEAHLTLIELDPYSARVSRHLFQGRRLSWHNESFERYLRSNPARRFDLVIGNPPFGPRGEDSLLDDAGAEREASRYFLLRALERLHPGGLLAMILPAGIAANPSDRDLRIKILCNAQVLALHGLPTATFFRAGTEVATTDLWLLAKRDSETAVCLEAGGEAALKAAGLWEGLFVEGRYFDQHPDHLHGLPAERSFVGGSTIAVREGGLEAALESLEAGLKQPSPERQGHGPEELIGLLEAAQERYRADPQNHPNLSEAIRRARKALAEHRRVPEYSLQRREAGLWVYRKGTWQQVDEQTRKAYEQGLALCDLLNLHQEALGGSQHDTAEALRVQLKGLLEQYRASYGLPPQAMKPLGRPEALLRLYAAFQGEALHPIFLSPAPKANLTLYDPTDLDSVLQALRRSGIPTTLTNILYAYKGLLERPLPAPAELPLAA